MPVGSAPRRAEGAALGVARGDEVAFRDECLDGEGEAVGGVEIAPDGHRHLVDGTPAEHALDRRVLREERAQPREVPGAERLGIFPDDGLVRFRAHSWLSLSGRQNEAARARAQAQAANPSGASSGMPKPTSMKVTSSMVSAAVSMPSAGRSV